LFIIASIMFIVIIGGLVILVLYKACKSARKKTSVLEFAGQVAVALDRIGPGELGFVRFHGEYWKARSDSIITSGQKARIIAKEGLTLVVEPFAVNEV
jgi:membrane-bound serine protease (ClpP class)